LKSVTNNKKAVLNDENVEILRPKRTKEFEKRCKMGR